MSQSSIGREGLQKLHEVERRFEEVTTLLQDPGITSDKNKYRESSKEHASLQPIVECYRTWCRVIQELDESKRMLEESSDPELKEMAREECTTLSALQERLETELVILLMPKDPNDDKNIILEIRAGTGGDEAALFCQELFSTYTKYAEGKRWHVEILDLSESSVGGFKEVIAEIAGQGAYSFLKYESGVHRVQRVPKTETQGRIHTSTVTVAVLPEAEEVDVEINDKDLRIDVYRSSGPGGQSVNTTDSAVRITHIPTGIVVTSQDQKSQHKNKAKAMTVLRSRILAAKQEEQDSARSSDRKSQIGTGERSEKIRTYNFPQSRVTDHRIGLTLYQLDTVVAGKLELLIEPLIAHFRSEALKQKV
jgi:peptide chain release factor 1